MLAYTACDDSYRALEIWEEICSSVEGPSYESILIAFRACETHPIGGEKAQKIWDKILQLDIEVTRDVYLAWLSALVANSRHEQFDEWLKRSGEFGVEVHVQM